MSKEEKIREDFEKTLDNYQEHYLKTTKQNDDPAGLVGPKDSFEEMQEWQFNLLKEHGLKPGDRLFDLGCGILRGGTEFIKYLETGNYIGCDISPKCLIHAHLRIHDQKIGHKKPTIVQNENLSFNRFEDLEPVDFLLAQSVWTHLPPKELKECVENMEKVLKEDATVIATAHIDNTLNEPKARVKGTSWIYPLEHLHHILKENNYVAEILEEEHPNNQAVLKISRAELDYCD